MKILTAEQIRQVDAYTIKNTPVSSIDLMERAARKCFEWIISHTAGSDSFLVICGPGNNGGDGLAIARMLIQKGYHVRVAITNAEKKSPDFLINYDRLKLLAPHAITEINSGTELVTGKENVIIDALLGTGLKKAVEGKMAALINSVNSSGKEIISIDLPSGLFCDSSSIKNTVVKATVTLTFQYLKPAFMVEENSCFTGKVEVLDIGLLKEAEENSDIRYFQTEMEQVKSCFKPRNPFSHKGNYGHALLLAGGDGKMGAAVMAARSCLRSGCGLLTMLVPQNCEQFLYPAIPEAMVITYDENGQSNANLSPFKSIGAGPGMGTGTAALSILKKVLGEKKPLLLDADALNLLSLHPELMNHLIPGTILTPHPGEFKRLAGSWNDDFDKLGKQCELSVRYKIYIILKGKNTSITTPEGVTWFNPTGNAGMAKGGSGDILTGFITGLLATGLSSFEACIAGSWLHGKAGDIASEKYTMEAMNAGDIIQSLPAAWETIIPGN